MESSWRPPTSSTNRPSRRAVIAAARGRDRCWRSRKSAVTARRGTAGRDMPRSLPPEEDDRGLSRAGSGGASGLLSGPMADTQAVRWPGDARAACAFTFDLDAETLWMARGISEPVTLSQGRFGVLEGVPRILAMLRAAQIHGTFFVPAWVATHYPDTVRAIAGEGHEIGCHGDEHESVTSLGPAREQE